ncbi:phage tail tape measure protein [Sphingosinicella sp. CPCC 101087]|uniref:phage tail tape measure protein n=1 Tax=Sphingosinicella sp. CPCC 101087 TaxID=2497754 RepID=UPI00101B6654|nr:phage tail tape measure protein [Sphingosinicella sp. CPCC 101087]
MDRNLRLQVIFDSLDRLTRPLRSIMGGSRAAARGLAETRREIRGLQQEQARIRGLRDLQKGLTDTHTKLDAARRRVRELRTEIAAADTPTKRLTNSLQSAMRAEAQLSRQTEEQSGKLRRLQSELGEAGVDVRDLARHEDQLASRIGETNRRLEQQRESLERTSRARERLERAQQRGERLRSTGRSMVVAGAVASAPLVASGVSAASFETQLTDIAQKADLARDRVAAIGREFDRMGPRVAQLPASLAEGVDTLLGLGASLPQSMQAIEPIARAATAYRAEVVDLSNATFASLQNLEVAAGDTGRTLDVMAQAGKAGAFELRDMAQYFPALTASANALGQRGVPAVADLAAALQITRRGAGDASTAANNLQNLLNKINARDTIANFKKLGIDLPAAMRRAAAEGRSPIEAIVELTRRATGGDLARLPFLFGDAQVQAALRPLVQGLDDYRQIRDEALAAQGTVATDFAERMRDSEQQYRRNTARLQQLAHTVGAALLPTFNRVMEVVGRLADRFSVWAERNPELVATLAKVAAIAALLLVGLGALAIAIGTVLGPFAYLRFMLVRAWPLIRGFGTAIMWAARVAFPLFQAAMLMLARGVMRAGAMMLANPVILIITLIVAAVAGAAYLIWQHWDTIRAAFDSAVGWLGRAWQSIKHIVVQSALFLTAPIRLQAASLMIVWDWIRGIFNGAVAFLSTLPSRMLQLGRNVIQGLINGLMAPMRLLQATIERIGNMMPGWLARPLGIRSPSRVFARLGGFVTDGLSQGIDRGAARPLARVRSLSRELTTALAVGAAAPAMAGIGSPGATSTRAAPAGSGPVTINIYPLPGQSSEDIAREVERILERREQQKAAERRSSFEDD